MLTSSVLHIPILNNFIKYNSVILIIRFFNSFRHENFKKWSKAVAALFHKKIKSKVDYKFFSEILEGESHNVEGM